MQPSVDDDGDQATVDTNTLLPKPITTPDGKSVEALMQRRLEIDRQLQALESETGSTSGGSLEDRNINTKHNNNNSQPSYRPPPQSPEYPYPGPLPPTDESMEQHTYAPQQQLPRHPLATAGIGAMFHAPPRISSSVSVGSGGGESYNNPSSIKTHGSAAAPYPFSNPYDPQFLAAAVTAFHHQQHLQHQQQQTASMATVNSGTTQSNAPKENSNNNEESKMLWKLLNDKEEELKEVRKALQETQQKFQEQSLLATKLQTTLDQMQEAFEKERLLIKMQAEKDAQEALTSRQEEIFQKQLQWMENNMKQQHLSQPQTTGASSDGTKDTATTSEPAKSNGSNVETATTQNEESATTNIAKKVAEKQYPWNANKGSPEKVAPKEDEREAPKITPSDEEKMLKIPKTSNSNSIKLYPSIDESISGNQNVESSNNGPGLPPNPMNQGQNVAQKPPLGMTETPMPTNMGVVNKSNSMNESASSDRFDPVYVVQNGNKEEEMAKQQRHQQEAAYSSNDDDGSLGQTVASSTYGDDRVKVTNKKLLDPYGDKGTYTGVVLRNTGMPHGLGCMVYEEDRRVFEGDWRHGRWHGYGRASFSNGDSYEGQYKFDQRHGNGIYRWNDGRVYDGQFSEDKRHGKGVFTWPDGAVYDGDFVNGQRQGHGKYTFADGGQYEGSWKDGRYDGFGTCTWEDGRRYRGEWRNGMAHGRGTETYPNGNIRHEGEWVDDEPIR